jgi:hypothetical protein
MSSGGPHSGAHHRRHPVNVKWLQQIRTRRGPGCGVLATRGPTFTSPPDDTDPDQRHRAGIPTLIPPVAVSPTRTHLLSTSNVNAYRSHLTARIGSN